MQGSFFFLPLSTYPVVFHLIFTLFFLFLIVSTAGTIQLAPSVQWWKNLDPGKLFLKRFVNRANTMSIVNGVPVCHNNTDDTGNYLFKARMPNGKYMCTG